QRFNFNNGLQNGDGIVRGLDADLSISELLDSVLTLPGQLSIGGSYVSRYEKNLSNTYDFPENVDGGAARLRYNLGGFQLSGEYAWTGLNPTATNSQIISIPDSLDPSVGLWNGGQGVNINATYSVRGFGVSFTASSLANMAYQSQRAAGSFDSWINYLPATSVSQTYALSQLYPYATQPNGEYSYRGDLCYYFDRMSVLGGKYGMKLELSYTHIVTPGIGQFDDLGTSREGVYISLFEPGNELYY